MCLIMNISRSAYYKQLHASPSQKQLDKQHEDERIASRIKEISSSNNSLFGTMTMYYTLRNEGYRCGHNRVYRLMCINDIKSSYRRRSKYNYIKSNAEHTAENILNRDFNTTGPNQKWCTDVTEIKVPTTGEKLFISPMIDLYNRFPVALEVSDRNDAAQLVRHQIMHIMHTLKQRHLYIQTEDSPIQDKYIDPSWKDTVCPNVCLNVLIMGFVKVFRDNLKTYCSSCIQTSLRKKR